MSTSTSTPNPKPNHTPAAIPTTTHLKPLLVGDKHESSRLVHTETRCASRGRDARQGTERV